MYNPVEKRDKETLILVIEEGFKTFLNTQLNKMNSNHANSNKKKKKAAKTKKIWIENKLPYSDRFIILLPQRLSVPFKY